MISWNNDCTLDSIRRIQLATVVYAGFRTILKDKNITVDIKLIFWQRVCSHFYYMLLIQGQLKRRWKKKWGVTEICIISTIRHKKLTLFGHICRMADNRLLKGVLFGSMEGVRCRGRQPKRWLDSITEWTGLSIGDAVKWHKTVMSGEISYLASVVHDHKTRWWWWWLMMIDDWLMIDWWWWMIGDLWLMMMIDGWWWWWWWWWWVTSSVSWYSWF